MAEEYIQEKYESIINEPFDGYYEGTQSLLVDKVRRHVIKVSSGKVADALRDILAYDPGDTVWKGATNRGNSVKLWAESLKQGGGYQFKITDVTFVEDLNWQKKYKGLFNVTVESC